MQTQPTAKAILGKGRKFELDVCFGILKRRVVRRTVRRESFGYICPCPPDFRFTIFANSVFGGPDVTNWHGPRLYLITFVIIHCDGAHDAPLRNKTHLFICFKQFAAPNPPNFIFDVLSTGVANENTRKLENFMSVT
ncbi:hypothetical protein [Glaciimonas sp. PAMC28666]|uniref:hypothetical protein n=1 Tax=Glaciimonas sp. PAMC28666 TaxID=2807626 RepID=UPI001965FE6E|nr:hypothetical protein [Glaciimonas sp. PAMC28666]QRX82613.1 hypothetical protein JQN73_21545 [Glaciimonas sp. PAMC28666]